MDKREEEIGVGGAEGGAEEIGGRDGRGNSGDGIFVDLRSDVKGGGGDSRRKGGRRAQGEALERRPEARPKTPGVVGGAIMKFTTEGFKDGMVGIVVENGCDISGEW